MIYTVAELKSKIGPFIKRVFEKVQCNVSAIIKFKSLVFIDQVNQLHCLLL